MERLRKGQMLLNLNKNDEAEKEFRKALSENPEDPYALALLAWCLLKKNNRKEALEFAKQAIGKAPWDTFFHMTLAQCYFYNKNFPKALEAIREGLNVDPTDSRLYKLKAEIEFMQEDWKQSLETINKAVELDPESVDIINFRAQVLVKLNRKAEAAETLDYALSKAPESTYSHANKGWVSIEQGQYKAAVSHFKEALRLDASNEYARNGLKEAIKAKNMLYRMILKYFLWMGKLAEKNQWAFIIGIYILYRIVLHFAETNPSLAPFLYPVVGLYIFFAFSTWIAKPISNLFLRLHPLGKWALNDDEKLGSNIAGLLGAGAIACIVIEFMSTESTVFGTLGILLAVMLIPVGGIFIVPPETKARQYLTYYSFFLAGLAVLWLIIPQQTLFILAFGLGIFAYGWVANYLTGRAARDF